MTNRIRKIINDPVYGFITIDDPLVFQVIAHPWYQRLRRIHQMAFAHLVYPGAVHTRLHHSLGAYHLMCSALTELKNKGVDITPEEETLPAKLVLPKASTWKTLYIGAGKKDKINKMDIVGMLLQKGGLQKEELGKIEVLDHSAYAAIKSNKIQKTLENIRNEKIKNRKIKNKGLPTVKCPQ